MSSARQVLVVRVNPKKESYAKGDAIGFEVNSVKGAEFYVWRIDGYGQRAIETTTPKLGLAFKEKSDLSKYPVEVGLADAPLMVNFKMSVSAYDNHYYNILLGEGKFEFVVLSK